MLKSPLFVGLLALLAAISVLNLAFRVIGLTGGPALYLACLVTGGALYFAGRRTLKGK